MSIEKVVQLKKAGRHAEAQALFVEYSKLSKNHPNIMKSIKDDVAFYRGKFRQIQDEEGNWVPYNLKKRSAMR